MPRTSESNLNPKKSKTKKVTRTTAAARKPKEAAAKKTKGVAAPVAVPVPPSADEVELEEAVPVGYTVKDSAASHNRKGLRRFTLDSFRSKRRRRKAERAVSRTKINHSFRIFNRSVGILWKHWEVFGGLALLYVVLNLLLVGGGLVNSDQLQAMKDTTSTVFNKDLGVIGTGATLYGFLIQNGVGLANGAASAYQTILFVLFSLVFVWALRQLYAGNAIRIRDALYNATYPLVQVMLTLLMVFVHLIPAFIGVFLFGSLVLAGIIVEPVQQIGVTLLTLVLLTWSAYLLTASIFALYIATLPDMTPLSALRTAKKLVRFRRGTILRKVLYLPLVLVPLSGLVVIPLTLLYTPLATIVFFMLATACVPLVHSYFYTLYRELIQ